MDGELLQVERGEVVLDFRHEQIFDGSALLGGRAEGGQEAREGVLVGARERGREGEVR